MFESHECGIVSVDFVEVLCVVGKLTSLVVLIASNPRNRVSGIKVPAFIPKSSRIASVGWTVLDVAVWIRVIGESDWIFADESADGGIVHGWLLWIRQ